MASEIAEDVRLMMASKQDGESESEPENDMDRFERILAMVTDRMIPKVSEPPSVTLTVGQLRTVMAGSKSAGVRTMSEYMRERLTASPEETFVLSVKDFKALLD